MKSPSIVKLCCTMLAQHVILPAVYAVYRQKKVRANLVVFADAHNKQLPFSMTCLYEAVRCREYEIALCCDDYAALGIAARLLRAVRFMKLYAQARYVFICDGFLPAASCDKRKETMLVQLWHGGGMLKKFGYDADDIPDMFRGHVYKNCDVVTVSSEVCVEAFAGAMRLPRSCVRATGTSRTDVYFDADYIEGCREEFRQKHPEAADKKIVVWAPTFRGSSFAPACSTDFERVLAGIKKLEEEKDVAVFRIGHPHQEKTIRLTNCKMPSERLLPLADVLITDYSSILFDYLLFEKPLVLFAPDLPHYEETRGFYLEYRSLPGTLVEDAQELVTAVRRALSGLGGRPQALREARMQYMKWCDGKATQRICNMTGMRM